MTGFLMLAMAVNGVISSLIKLPDKSFIRVTSAFSLG